MTNSAVNALGFVVVSAGLVGYGIIRGASDTSRMHPEGKVPEVDTQDDDDCGVPRSVALRMKFGLETLSCRLAAGNE